MSLLASLPGFLLVVLGFGFIIFIHELGHFLAAKAVGIKVEQFAVGFGKALVCWRKGIGLTMGTSAHLAQRYKAEGREGIGETEYRLNWIPLGGYVKMLGQDDMNPASTSTDPRSYNSKSVGARMLVISAGVIMNIIFAAVGFMALFLIGYSVPPAVIGNVVPGSPAFVAGLQVGDRIISIDGKPISDFTKVPLAVALHDPARPLEIKIERMVDGTPTAIDVSTKPVASDERSGGLLQIGIGPASWLRGPTEKEMDGIVLDPKSLPASFNLLQPGDVITHVQDKPVTLTDEAVLDQAVQNSGGSPLTLTVLSDTGTTRTLSFRPGFRQNVDQRTVVLAGFEPRAVIESIQPNSSAYGKILPGDVVEAVTLDRTKDLIPAPSPTRLFEILQELSKTGGTLSLTVLRDGQRVEVTTLTPNLNLGQGRRGLGVTIGSDDANAVVGGVREKSPATATDLQPGATITHVNNTAVSSWFDVRRELLGFYAASSPPAANEAGTADGSTAAPPQTYSVMLKSSSNGTTKTVELKLTDADFKNLQDIRLDHGLPLASRNELRRTNSLLTAASWGVGETRDSMLQFYVTLRRMVEGTVSVRNASGPVGIFHAGTLFASRGYDWLLWFLCIISANLAVVNFLPIPIMDGGHFVFLLLEKIRGKPLSERTQVAAQVFGLILIGSLFVLVTFQDITRLL